MADQSLMENYTIAGQKDVARTLSGSQGCYGTRVGERSQSTVLDAIHGLSERNRSNTIIHLLKHFHTSSLIRLFVLRT